MTSFTLFSEPVAATGSMSAKGAKESLGRPRLDPLVVLTREAAQNSWDARKPGRGPVQFAIRGATLGDIELDRWREAFSDIPPDGLRLTDVLSHSSIDVLYVSDLGTTGLSGQTRADKAGDHGGRDFVDFMRNVGQPRDTELGGGTYGYGKSIFYSTSQASAIVAYTRTEFGGQLESRLMGAALGDYYTHDGLPHTGRHWWGEYRDGIIEPLLNNAADELARALGFTPFDTDQTGTNIAIVGFEGLDHEGNLRSGRESMDILAEAIAWHCWPKWGLAMRPDEMTFTVRWNGDNIDIPDTRIPVIRAYRKALERVLRATTQDEPDSVHMIESKIPKKLLGRLAIERTLRQPTDYVILVAPYDGPAHHVALMRDPAMVIKYQPGPLIPDENVEWAAVFHADRDVDDAFARSEPPTHDDWVSHALHKPEKTYVNVAYTRIRDVVDRELTPATVVETGIALPLGELSARLGSLIAPAPGTGGRPIGSRTAGGGQRRGMVRITDWELIHHLGMRAVRAEFEATPLRPGAILKIQPEVIVDGGRHEDSPPEGAAQPELLGVEIGGIADTSSSFQLDGPVVGTVIVSVPDDTMVGVNLKLEEPDAKG